MDGDILENIKKGQNQSLEERVDLGQGNLDVYRQTAKRGVFKSVKGRSGIL